MNLEGVQAAPSYTLRQKDTMTDSQSIGCPFLDSINSMIYASKIVSHFDSIATPLLWKVPCSLDVRVTKSALSTAHATGIEKESCKADTPYNRLLLSKAAGNPAGAVDVLC